MRTGSGMSPFAPPVAERIAQLIKNAATDRTHPLAVFDLDNTCIRNDVGEAVFHHLVDHFRLPFGSALFDHIGAQYHSGAIAELVGALRECPAAVRLLHPLYPAYRRLMLGAYYERLTREGPAAAYPWIVQCMAGMEEAQVIAANREAIARELATPIGTERINTAAGDPFPLTLARGLRPFPEMTALFRELHAAGFTLGIISASSRWAVAEMIRACEWPVHFSVGIAVEVAAGQLTDTLIAPVPCGAGKVAALQADQTQAPVLVVGDSRNDFPLLAEATACAIWIDHGDPALRAEAAKRGWLVQPAFA